MGNTLRIQNDYVRHLNGDIQTAIYHYTSITTNLNNHLLRKLSLFKKDKWVADRLDQAFAGVPMLDTSIHVYRGIHAKDLYLDINAYVSTSFSRKIALERFVYRFSDEIACCLLDITIPIGAKILPIVKEVTKFDEKEILLPIGGYFILDRTYKLSSSKGTHPRSWTDPRPLDRPELQVYELTYVPPIKIKSVVIKQTRLDVEMWTERIISMFEVHIFSGTYDGSIVLNKVLGSLKDAPAEAIGKATKHLRSRYKLLFKD